jgi:stage II sporulation protein D
MHAVRIYILIFGLSCGSALGMSGKKPTLLPPPEFQRQVPVLLHTGPEAVMDIYGLAALECYRGVKLSEVYYFSSEVRLFYRENGIEVRDFNGLLTAGLTEVLCKPRSSLAELQFAGRSYRGYFRCVYRGDLESMTVINVVDMEDYLAGVLPAEIGERSPDEYEAAKVQAVAARTYAVWKLTNGRSDEVLIPTIADQVYSGRSSEMDLLTRAVVETAGEILIYDGRPISAYYHAVCGGQTSPLEKVWPEREPADYLQGVADDDFCSWAKTYAWKEEYDYSDLRRKLEDYLVGLNYASTEDFEDVLDIDFFTDDVTGRKNRIMIATGTAVFSVEYDQIRWALGRPSVPGAILPSTMFEVAEDRDEKGRISLSITGRGNGHGVGLCQCGAIGRARAGQKYDRILKTYYKGAELAKIY